MYILESLEYVHSNGGEKRTDIPRRKICATCPMLGELRSPAAPVDLSSAPGDEAPPDYHPEAAPIQLYSYTEGVDVSMPPAI
jgi:hypothetical protein